MVILSLLLDPRYRNLYTHIVKCCFTDTRVIARLLRCQANINDMDKNGNCQIASFRRGVDKCPNFSEYIYKANSRFSPSQWETALQSNFVSHWLDANLESALL